MPDIFERTCRVCGCWEMQACPQGCYWVAEDLCSACAVPGQDGEVLLLPQPPAALGTAHPTPAERATIQQFFDAFNDVFKRASTTAIRHFQPAHLRGVKL